MPANRLSMRKIKEVLRLKWANDLSDRKIAQSCNVSRPAVANYIERAEQAGLSWPLPDTLNDTELERLLFPARHKLSGRDRVPPDLLKVHQELQKKNVTLFLLWQEYREQHPKGYQYSWFCDQYRNWLGKRDLSMRQTHRAGEKLFVDYAGHTLSVIDPRTGEIRSAQIFVAVLGASNYTYAEATWSQSLPDWIGSHQRSFTFLGGLKEKAERILNASLDASKVTMEQLMRAGAKEVVTMIKAEVDASLNRIRGTIKDTKRIGLMNMVSSCITLLAGAVLLWSITQT